MSARDLTEEAGDEVGTEDAVLATVHHCVVLRLQHALLEQVTRHFRLVRMRQALDQLLLFVPTAPKNTQQ